MKAFAPKRLIPTVNVKGKANFDGMVAKFADLMNLTESKAHIDRFFVVSKNKADATPAAEPHACVMESPASVISSYSKRVPETPNQAEGDSAVALPCQSLCLCSRHSAGTSIAIEPAQKLRKLGSGALQSVDPNVETVWDDSIGEVDVCEIFDL